MGSVGARASTFSTRFGGQTNHMDGLWVMKWNLVRRHHSDFQNASH